MGRLLSNTAMLELSLDGLVFNSLLGSFGRGVFKICSVLWDHIDKFVSIDMRNVISLVFNGIIIGEFFLVWYGFSLLNWSIVNMSCFIWDLFNS